MSSDYQPASEEARSPNDRTAASEATEQKSAFPEVFKLILKLSSLVALSYTVSFQFFMVGILARFINETEALNSSDINGTSTNTNEAAATLLVTLLSAVTVIVGAPLCATSIVVSRDLGKRQTVAADTADNENLASRIAASNRNGILFTLFLSPAAILPLYYSSAILDTLGQTTPVANIVQSFLRPYSSTAPGLFLSLVFEKIFFSFKQPEATTLIAFPIFLGASTFAVLMSLGYGFSPLGLQGIYLPYMINNYLVTVAYAFYLGFKKEFKEFQFFNFCKLGLGHFDQLLETMKIGSSIVVSCITEVAIFLLLSLFAGTIGEPQLADLNTVLQLYNFAFMVFGPLGEICSQEISRQVGAKNYKRENEFALPSAHEVAKYGLATTAICTAPACAIAIVIFYILNGTKDPLEGVMFLLFATGIYFHGLRYNLLQQQIALSDKMYSSIISTACVLGGLGISALLGFLTEWGSTGLGLGYLAGSVSGFVGLLLRWLTSIKPETMAARATETPRKKPCCSRQEGLLVSPESLLLGGGERRSRNPSTVIASTAALQETPGAP
jgi:Na+-driven multidrug efflux pump